MKVEYVQGAAKSQKADLLVVPVLQDKKLLERQVADVDRASRGLVSRRIAREKFTGKKDQQLIVDVSGLGSPRVMIHGLGVPEKFDTEVFRRAAAKALASARNGHSSEVAIVLPSGTSVPDALLARAAAEGGLLGLYRYLRYKTEDKPEKVKRLVLVGTVKRSREIDASLAFARIASDATNFTRDLVNDPAGDQPPAELARVAQSLAGKEVEVEVHAGEALQAIGARAILAVSAGSLEPPQLIELRYAPSTPPRGGKRRKIAVVGKGLTFDSGGLSLKTADGMMTMKCDMAGAAAVLGLFRALPRLKPDVEVVGLIGATENMPGARAQKPGDVIRSMSGKTIEVLNTDAEGRLVLADVLHYARTKYRPDAIIDLATLTGAVVVGLGDWYAGAMGNDQRLLDEVLAAARRADEKFWPLPLDEDMRSKIDSDVADIKNITGDRYGGSITAGLFLREFVGDASWVHLDIAGPAFAEKTPPIGPKGGTGFGVRTLMEFCRGVSS